MDSVYPKSLAFMRVMGVLQGRLTTLRIGSLDYWDRAIELIRARVADASHAAGLNKEVEIHAPVGIRADLLTRAVLRRIVQEFKLSTSGAVDVEIGGGKTKIIWREMIIVQRPAGSESTASFSDFGHQGTEHFSFATYSGVSAPRASASRVVRISAPNEPEMFVKSLRNTINGKKSQLNLEAPTLLFIESGNKSVSGDFICHLLETRVWPNPQYAWLTGVCIVEPRRTFNAGDGPNKITVSWNTSPRERATEALVSLMEGRTRFSAGKQLVLPP